MRPNSGRWEESFDATVVRRFFFFFFFTGGNEIDEETCNESVTLSILRQNRDLRDFR